MQEELDWGPNPKVPIILGYGLGYGTRHALQSSMQNALVAINSPAH